MGGNKQGHLIAKKIVPLVYLPLFTTFTKEQRHAENVFGVKNGQKLVYDTKKLPE